MTQDASATRHDVVALLDRAPFRGVAVRVATLLALAMIFDGFDIQAIAFAAPKVLEEFAIERAQLGPILAASLVGMAIGAFLLGSLGDRLGRRFGVIASLLIIGAASLGAAFAQGPGELAAWRLATGLGLGGVVPNCTALMMEFAPLRVRSLVVAFTIVGVPIGGVVGAEVAAQIMPVFGWRAVFVIGAVLPGVLALAMLPLLPESPRYLARRGHAPARLAAMLNRITGRTDLSADMTFEVREAADQGARVGVSALFSAAFRHTTLVLWLIFVTNIFAVYAFFNWLPTVLTSSGLALTVALRGALVFNLGGVVAALVLAQCVSRFGSRRTLIVVGSGAIATMAVLGFLPIAEDRVGLLLALMALGGGCILGMQVCMFAVAASAYPTSIRTTGVGWASGIARFGGIVSSFAGAYLLSLSEGAAAFFLAIAAVLTLTLAGVILLRSHLAPVD